MSPVNFCSTFSRSPFVIWSVERKQLSMLALIIHMALMASITFCKQIQGRVPSHLNLDWVKNTKEKRIKPRM